MNDLLLIQKHDLHKIRTRDYESHANALKNELMAKADKLTSRMSRNWQKFKIDLIKPYRISLISNRNLEVNRQERRIIQDDLNVIFDQDDAYRLHEQILKSKSLNRFVEALSYPYSSLKYHLLLTTAVYFNLKNGIKWPQDKLYLVENPDTCSEFQIIFNRERTWALLPDPGMSRVQFDFAQTWRRRILISIGGEDEELASFLSRINSWSSALAFMEDWK